ncbi:MAG: hypothetical protein P1P76_04720 [Anaerolineales bacterium]|nr:hypothetical protein [Anaerolineales bacterium]
MMKASVRLAGDDAWRFWDGLISRSGSLVGKLKRFRVPPGSDPIGGMMSIVDWADGLISVQGKWIERGPGWAVKEITSCPHAERLKAIPQFCTRLGVAMGVAAFNAYAPDIGFQYEIPCTLSKGDPVCKYTLEVDRSGQQNERT